MSRKLILYIAASVDGYIATEEDSLEWLFESEGEGDNGYFAFYETIETILLGRRTYDWILEKEKGNFPYKNKTSYVFSKTQASKAEWVEFVNVDPVAFTKKLKEEEGGPIWLAGGGGLIQPLLKAGLVDELILTFAPALIGKGIRLFNPDDYEFRLVLKDMKRYGQMAELHYEVKN
jgi:dihydrofolate reductase